MKSIIMFISFVITILFSFNLSIISNAYGGAQEAVWERVSVSYGIDDSRFRMVKINPVNPDTVYVGSPNSIYKTTDGGRTWKELVSLRRTARTINTIILDPLRPDTVYAGTRTGLYISNNGGVHWRRIFRGIRKSEDFVLSVSINRHDTSIIFMGTESGVYRSINRGKDWKQVQSFPSGTPVFSIVIDGSDPRIVYAVTDKELYKSSDSGEKWTEIHSAGITAKGRREANSGGTMEINGKEINIEFNSEVEIPHKRLITALAVDPADNSMLYISTLKGVFAGKDRGKAWTALSKIGLTSGDIRQLSIDNTNSIYAATDRGVARYIKDEKKWTLFYKGMTSDITYDIDVNEALGAELTVLWAVTSKGIYKTIL